ncbi:hypothetical protein PhaeoP18_01793 [Phaeobacter piscinae]|uniref:Uncharacterized protein n=1 Tax=Phaeobacter piscinae TaxID=1580596 RepID=A0AAN1GRB5_9RHOB|nr:hypothetical protein PhaeoP13_01817 [Phaeobacter piscinae]AUR36062.1 hypothetical protein PhaeoP18_01793 [Phaeobacter piscinae]
MSIYNPLTSISEFWMSIISPIIEHFILYFAIDFQ